MKVREILSQAAFLLGKQELSDFFSGTETEATTTQLQQEADAFLRCYNMVENEVALDYLPLTTEQRLETESGKLVYTAFLRTPVSIVSVTDRYGNRLPYTVYPAYLRTKQGTAVVTYSYAPTSKTLSGESEFVARVSQNLLAFGVAGEYCLTKGMYEEAVVWDKKFRDALLCACAQNSPHVVRSRRWI
jgi:hypothetical protein